MEPDNVGFAGIVMVGIGVVCAIFAMVFLGQGYQCVTNLGSTCPPDISAKFGVGFALLTLGTFIVIFGSATFAAGYVAVHMAKVDSDKKRL